MSHCHPCLPATELCSLCWAVVSAQGLTAHHNLTGLGPLVQPSATIMQTYISNSHGLVTAKRVKNYDEAIQCDWHQWRFEVWNGRPTKILTSLFWVSPFVPSGPFANESFRRRPVRQRLGSFRQLLQVTSPRSKILFANVLKSMVIWLQDIGELTSENWLRWLNDPRRWRIEIGRWQKSCV